MFTAALQLTQAWSLRRGVVMAMRFKLQGLSNHVRSRLRYFTESVLVYLLKVDCLYPGSFLNEVSRPPV